MKESYKKLLDGNKKFAQKMKDIDPDYFKKISLGQKPDYLWIGCSDSRVPANEITGTQSGEIFVHRNIANLVVHTDINLLSVLYYSVHVLQVKHIIVCGHYGCGGIQTAMKNQSIDIMDNWLRNIKDVYLKYINELEAISDSDKRADRLAELNVIEQVRNLAKTSIVQNAWKKNQPLHIHGWIYGLNSGLIKELTDIYDNKNDIEKIYHYD